MMLGIAHTLMSEGLHDRPFLDRFCVGYPEFEAYLSGRSDGQPKHAAWAAAICDIPADTIRCIARQAAGKRTLITCAQSLQRAEHGEQPVWMGVVLAAMLGQVGLPGGGFVYAMGSLANVGKPRLAVPLPTLPQGRNTVPDYIPVARIADLLLQSRPGLRFQRPPPDLSRTSGWFTGPAATRFTITRTSTACGTPSPVPTPSSCTNSAWTAIRPPRRHRLSRHRDHGTLRHRRLGQRSADGGDAPGCRPFAQSRDDYSIFSDLAQRLGIAEAFTEGRTAEDLAAASL